MHDSATTLERACHRLLRLFGWTVDVVRPTAPRGVIIVYPHTSNWDFVVGYLAKVAAGLPVQWIGKESLFRFPFAAMLRRMGGIPVRRGARAGVVGELTQEFAKRDHLWIVITPEGTRSRTDHWKSGFYHLALAARVPLGLASIDYGRRRVELRTYLDLTGDLELDLSRVRACYRGVVGLFPERTGEIRLRSE